MRPGRTPVEPGTLATVVTTLESDGTRPPVPASDLTLARWEEPGRDRYRSLFRAVGADWLWYSRLAMADAALDAVLSDPLVRVWRVHEGARTVGLLELDNGQVGQCELSFVGMVPALTGRGHGRWLLAEALRLACGSRVERVVVRTCTLDHPAALPAYQRAGFRALAREVQVFPDPRLIGLLPRSAAAHVPLIRP